MLNESSFGPSKAKLSEWYEGKSVAIAGGAGFVGIQLTRLMVDLVGSSGRVLVLDDFSRGQNIVREDNVLYVVATPSDCYYPYKSILGSTIRALHVHTGVDVSRNNYSYLLEGVDVFFNLAAAVAGVLHNESHHLQMYDDNIRLLTGPLRACEQAGVQEFFQTSSVCVYAEDRQSPCNEAAGWGGDPHPANAGYAEAKRDGERAAYWSDIDRVTIGRPSNVVGPYDYFDGRAHVVPAFIHRAYVEEGSFTAYGDPEAQREFIYSWDVATGMAYIAAFGEDRMPYNIGTGGTTTTTMLSLAADILQLVGYISEGKDSNREIQFDWSKGGGDSIRFSDNTKLESLGWRNSTSLDKALFRAVDEYKYRGAWEDPDYWGLVDNQAIAKMMGLQ